VFSIHADNREQDKTDPKAAHSSCHILVVSLDEKADGLRLDGMQDVVLTMSLSYASVSKVMACDLMACKVSSEGWKLPPRTPRPNKSASMLSTDTCNAACLLRMGYTQTHRHLCCKMRAWNKPPACRQCSMIAEDELHTNTNVCCRFRA